MHHTPTKKKVAAERTISTRRTPITSGSEAQNPLAPNTNPTIANLTQEDQEPTNKILENLIPAFTTQVNVIQDKRPVPEKPNIPTTSQTNM